MNSEVNAPQSQIGVIGDTKVEGGMHFYAPSPTTTKPLQRPPRVAHFTDREPELARLLADLQPDCVVTLCGPGGIGKTALAAEAVWTLAPYNDLPTGFPHGVIFYSFYGRSDVSLAFEHIVRSFNEEAQDTSAEAAARILSNKQALLILDGAEEASDLHKVLQIRGRCGVLITSRSLDDAVADWQDLPPLSVERSVQLLNAWAGEYADNDLVVQHVCKLVGGLPLAVRLIGFYLARRKQRATMYYELLQTSPLRALNFGKRREQNVPLLLDQSVEQLSEKAKKFLALIGVLALAPFEGEVASAVFDVPSFEAEFILGELVGYGLLLKPDIRYVASHALIHTYAHQRLNVPLEILKKLGNYFIRYIHEYQDRKMPESEIIDEMHQHMMALVTRFAEDNVQEPMIKLAHLLSRSRGDGYLQLKGLWNDEEICIGLAVNACDLLIGDSEVSTASQWIEQKASFNYALGDLFFHRNQNDKAYEKFIESQNLYQLLESQQEKLARLSLRLGEIHLQKRDIELATSLFENSLTICKTVKGIDSVRAATYFWLGQAYHLQEDFVKAQSYYEKSLQHYSCEENVAECAFVFIRLASLAFDRLNREMTLDHLKRAEALLDKTAKRSRLIATARRELANHYLWKWNNKDDEDWEDNFNKAEDLHLVNLQHLSLLGDKENFAWTLHNLGDTYFEWGKFEKAEEMYREALKYFKAMGILTGIAYGLDRLGQISLIQRQFNHARDYFLRGLDVFMRAGTRSGPGWIYLNLGDLENAEGKTEEAIKYYNKSLQVWRKIKHKRRIAVTKNRLKEATDSLQIS